MKENLSLRLWEEANWELLECDPPTAAPPIKGKLRPTWGTSGAHQKAFEAPELARSRALTFQLTDRDELASFMTSWLDSKILLLRLLWHMTWRQEACWVTRVRTEPLPSDASSPAVDGDESIRTDGRVEAH